MVGAKAALRQPATPAEQLLALGSGEAEPRTMRRQAGSHPLHRSVTVSPPGGDAETAEPLRYILASATR